MTGFTQEPLGRPRCFHLLDCHHLWLAFPCHLVSKWFGNSHVRGPTTPIGKTRWVWAAPLSLAATNGIDVSFFSSRYLDVSVPWVDRLHLWIQCRLIRVFRDQRLFDNYPGLFAVFHARHRLLTPRHPPCALSSLTTNIHNSPPSHKTIVSSLITRQRMLRLV